MLAQWAPWPDHLAYAVHVGICVVAGAAMFAVPETRFATPDAGRLIDDLKIPSLLADESGRHPIALSALMSVTALGSGFLIQSLARKIDSPRGARGALDALAILTVGMFLAAWAAALSIVTALLAAVVLGCGYGMALVAGLLLAHLSRDRRRRWRSRSTVWRLRSSALPTAPAHGSRSSNPGARPGIRKSWPAQNVISVQSQAVSAP